MKKIFLLPAPRDASVSCGSRFNVAAPLQGAPDGVRQVAAAVRIPPVGGRLRSNQGGFKRNAFILLLLTLMLLAFASCGREKHGNFEFLYQEETDSYTLIYYTDSAAVSELVIPDTFKDKPVIAIGQLAIGSCDTLEKIVIGKNIQEIDKWGIVDCRYLKVIEVDEENEHFTSLDGVLYSKDMTKIITYPNAHTAEYAQDGKLLKPASYTVAPGTNIIGHCAFYKCYGLEKVILPDSVEEIEDRAFHKCEGMTEINFPEGLHTIGKDAFLACRGLEEVTLPSTIRVLGEYVFYNADNIKTLRILTSQENVTLGNKWYPTSAGRDISVEIIWGE